MVAKKWRPSPSTCKCSQASPCAMKRWTSEGGGSAMRTAIITQAGSPDANPGGSVPDLVADAQEVQAQPAHHRQAAGDHREAGPRRHVADAEEAAAEAVDHVEERIQVAHRQPHRRQR